MTPAVSWKRRLRGKSGTRDRKTGDGPEISREGAKIAKAKGKDNN
jgi:hypothetical protein